MTPAALISTLTSGTRPNLDVDIARAVLALARSGASDTGLQTLSVGDLDIPVRLTASVSALPHQVHSVEAYTFREFSSGAMLVVDGTIGIGLVAGNEVLAVNITRPVS